MEENEHRDLFCEQCLLQFGKKYVFDLHLSLVHGKKVDFSEFQVDGDISKDNGENYPLAIGNYSCSQKVHMKEHIETVHEKKKSFKCAICNYLHLF